MSQRAKKAALKHAAAKRRGWIWIALMISPVLLLAGLILTSFLNGGGPNMERGRQARAAEEARLRDVNLALATFGAVARSNHGSYTVELPHSQAMTATEVEAKELALMAHSRLGGPVKVTSPAGQVLAQVP